MFFTEVERQRCCFVILRCLDVDEEALVRVEVLAGVGAVFGASGHIVAEAVAVIVIGVVESVSVIDDVVVFNTIIFTLEGFEVQIGVEGVAHEVPAVAELGVFGVGDADFLGERRVVARFGGGLGHGSTFGGRCVVGYKVQLQCTRILVAKLAVVYYFTIQISSITSVRSTNGIIVFIVR